MSTHHDYIRAIFLSGLTNLYARNADSLMSSHGNRRRREASNGLGQMFVRFLMSLNRDIDPWIKFQDMNDIDCSSIDLAEEGQRLFCMMGAGRKVGSKQDP